MAILLSELGDKTFFLTVVLAVRRGRIMALAAACTALWLMTGVSSGLGVALRSFPEALGSQKIVDVAAAVLMVVFGVQALRESTPDEKEEDSSEKDEAESEIDDALAGKKGDEKAAKNSWVYDWLRFSVLIFLAEWGDRSMLATVTLAATRSPIGVFLGGCLGHLSAAILAVACSSILEKYVSDRAVKISSGVLFIAFGVTTALGVY